MDTTVTAAPSPMKGLSLHPRWAGAVASGIKTLEIRSRPTHYRGPIVICSSKKPAHPGVLAGHALCTTEILDCRPMRPEDVEAAGGVPYDPTAYAWVLAPAVPLSTPFPVKGALSFFPVLLP